MTNDHDFNGVFDKCIQPKIDIINGFDGFEQYASKEFKIASINQIEDYLKSDYFKESFFENVGIVYDVSLTEYSIKKIIEDEEESLVHVELFCVSNETKYNFIIKYDYFAMEIIDVETLISND